MNAKEKRLMQNKLRTLTPNFKVPDGYKTWLDFLKRNKRPPHPYKSWLEYRLFAIGALKDVPYEPEVLPYTQKIDRKRKYTPDGVKGDVIIEVKGRFRTRDEAEKYKSVRANYPDKTLVFVFARRGVKFLGAKKRKDGSLFTLEEWCKREGFPCCFEGDDIEVVIAECQAGDSIKRGKRND